MSPHARYLGYVLRHKWFVFLAGLKTGAPLWRLIIHDWSKLTPAEWSGYMRKFQMPIQVGETVAGVADNAPFQGVVLKTRPADQPGKVDCFLKSPSQPWPSWFWSYEISERVEVDAAFDRAWLHHIHANPHHWDHWVLKAGGPSAPVTGFRALPMPEPLVREMVADWMGAGRAQGHGDDLVPWYAKNRDRMVLHPETRRLVELLISAHATAARREVAA